MAGITNDQLAARLAAIEASLKDLRDDVSETREMVDAWQAVKTGGKAVTWISKVLAAIIAIMLAVKGGAAFIADLGSK